MKPNQPIEHTLPLGTSADLGKTQALPCCNVCGLALLQNSDRCPRCSGDPTRTWVVRTPVPDEPTGNQEAPTPLTNDARYEVLETLGRGGMGVVYKVRDLELDEVIALKVLAAEAVNAELAVERFKREIKIARRINHPNAARLYDLFPWRGRLAISQEYIEGHDLERLLRDGALPVGKILHYLKDICGALQAAHEIGVVHRDLKPGNVRIDGNDRARILDFGLAALVRDVAAERGGEILGTPAFMAPEMATAPDQVDSRTDIYSLGVMLFAMATGTLPFRGGTTSEVIYAHIHATPPRPHVVSADVPLLFSDVILRCLEKDPERRFASVEALLEQAQRAVPPERVHHSSGVFPPVSRDSHTRGKVLVIEDEPSDRALLAAELKRFRTLSIEATDGYSGIEAAIREEPDLILLDIDMPVLDGREALRILKSNPKTAAIPVVILAEVEDEEEEMLAMDLGAVMFLNKPVKAEILGLLLDRYLTVQKTA